MNMKSGRHAVCGLNLLKCKALLAFRHRMEKLYINTIDYDYY